MEVEKTFAMDFEKTLRETFGFESFRAHQREIIEAVVRERRDVCCVMPTGHGKSICYQLPPIVTGQPAIIISPLLSLMEDQRLGLAKSGIKACCYNSSLTNKAKTNQELLAGDYTHIYITPETVVNCEELLKSLYRKFGLCLIAIDESHCVSLWGNTFRSTYLRLSILKDWFPSVPVLALTGTATTKVEEDIISLLKLRYPLRIRTSSNRPNLSFFVHPKTDPLTDLKPHLGENCIVYCQTRKDTESIAELLTASGVLCSAFHAGLSDVIRTQIHHQFLDGRITCIVATICFGMGIDKADIRRVIHYGCPKDIESYCQETGRAGRDGKLGQCHIYFSSGDFAVNRYFLKDIADDRLRQYKEEVTRLMEKYLFVTTCRRRYMLEYFGETSPPQAEGVCCDNCQSPKAVGTTMDIGPHVKAFLEFCQEFPGKYGKMMYIRAIRGENLKKMPNEFRNSSSFGRGKSFSVDWWKACVQHILNVDLVASTTLKGRFGSTISVTPAGLAWLASNQDSPSFPVDADSMVAPPKVAKTKSAFKPTRKLSTK